MNANAMDDDFLFDDTVYKNPSPLMLGVHDTNPTQFTFPVIVPWKDLTKTEPDSEEHAEIYCKVIAEHKPGNQLGFVARRDTDKQNIRIRPPSEAGPEARSVTAGEEPWRAPRGRRAAR